MPKIYYNKLVRVRIPEIIQSEGRTFETEIMNDDDYKQALRDKILEEGREVANASGDDLIKELSDLYEVIDALLDAEGISRDDVLERQKRRRQERGGFEERIRLLWTDDE